MGKPDPLAGKLCLAWLGSQLVDHGSGDLGDLIAQCNLAPFGEPAYLPE